MANRKLLHLNYAITGVGDRDAVLDIERTPYIEGLIEQGWISEITAAENLSGAEPLTETSADVQAAGAAALVPPPPALVDPPRTSATADTRKTAAK